MTGKRRICTLVITHSCNLNCLYCYEHKKDSLTMPFELAKKLLEYEFKYIESCSEFDELEIDFMGGEPLLEFSLIRKISEWLWSKQWPCPYICFATTNGTLISNDNREWHRTAIPMSSHHFKCCLSLRSQRSAPYTTALSGLLLIASAFITITPITIV